MPYASNATLPETVRAALPEAAQSVWREAFNAGGDDVAASVRKAWEAVNVEKAEYQGREVELDKPFRLPSGSAKKFGVYVKSGDSVKRVTFGDPNMEIRRDDPEARANFRARHSCDAKTDKTTPGYWSCRMWNAGFSVSDELSKSEAETCLTAKVAKVDESLGLVFGWAIVSEINGEPYVDTQGDYIPSDVAMKSISKFMRGERTAKAMHVGERVGSVDMAFPMTQDIMKALGIECEQTGVIVAMRPDSDDLMKRYRDGDYTGFSIGGSAMSVEMQ